MPDNAVLELQGIEKRYGHRMILDKISLRILAGECVTLTGENGCGKSTLLRIAAGLTRPTRGGAAIHCPGSVQYVPDQFPPIALTGRQFLRSMARVDCDIDEELIRRFHMDAYLGNAISSYSKGMRSKIGVLQALLARPKLLLMDEPVAGQDADSREVFIHAVKALMKSGCAVFMACHEQDLANALSTGIYHIRGGQLVEGNWLNAPDDDACLCKDCGLFANGACGGKEKRHA